MLAFLPAREAQGAQCQPFRGCGETYAAATKHKIINRSSPLELLPVLPLKKGSDIVSAIVVGWVRKIVVDSFLTFLTSGSGTQRTSVFELDAATGVMRSVSLVTCGPRCEDQELEDYDIFIVCRSCIWGCLILDS